MTRHPFIIVHAGVSVQAYLLLDAARQVRHIELGGVRQGAVPPWWHAFTGKCEFLNDLLAADVPFEAIATCRRSPGINGAILEAAWQALEGLNDSLGAKHAG